MNVFDHTKTSGAKFISEDRPHKPQVGSYCDATVATVTVVMVTVVTVTAVMVTVDMVTVVTVTVVMVTVSHLLGPHPHTRAAQGRSEC